MQVRRELRLRSLRSTRSHFPDSKFISFASPFSSAVATTNIITQRLVNVLRGAGQEVPEALLQFGTTVKRKQHDSYGAFFKNVDTTQVAKKIKFDD